MNCPECSHPWRIAPEVEVRPEPGDVTVCDGCGRILRFRRRVFSGDLYLNALSERDERRLRTAVRSRLLDLTPRA